MLCVCCLPYHDGIIKTTLKFTVAGVERMTDATDAVIDQWRRELPSVDNWPISISSENRHAAVCATGLYLLFSTQVLFIALISSDSS